MEYLRTGTILRINLTDGKITKEPTDPYVEKFVGGMGINTKLLYEGVGPEVKPLDPENMIILGVGPLVGTLYPACNRVHATFKSPVTKAIGQSNMGGFFGPELKFAGYDHVVIQGRSEKPVYIYINNEYVGIKDAQRIWGKDCYEGPKIIQEELKDPEIKVISIGPAGERKVLYSTVNSPVGQSFSRNGMGAVMGSKNLKAIAVRGTKGVRVADPDKFFEESEKAIKTAKNSAVLKELREYGFTKIADIEHHNMFVKFRGQKELEDFSKAASKTAFAEKYTVKTVGCFGCPVSCKKYYRVPGNSYGVLFCTLYGDFTWTVKNADTVVMAEAGFMCNQYGVDSRSMCTTILWLMDLYEKGIIDEKDTDGIPMNYGSKDAILKMLKKMIYREGIGDILAEGMEFAAEKIGRGAKDHIVHVKNSPMAIHVPPLKAWTLGAVVSATGEGIKSQVILMTILDPAIAEAQDEGAVKTLIEQEEAFVKKLTGDDIPADPRVPDKKGLLIASCESANLCSELVGICVWLTGWLGESIVPGDMARILSIGLGTTVTERTLLEAATRLKHLQRAYEVREGFARDYDKVSEAYFRRERVTEKNKNLLTNSAELEAMKDEYYEVRGWDVGTGIPTRETLQKFGLKDIADDLESRGVWQHGENNEDAGASSRRGDLRKWGTGH